jgi:hypothetical protein
MRPKELFQIAADLLQRPSRQSRSVQQPAAVPISHSCHDTSRRDRRPRPLRPAHSAISRKPGMMLIIDISRQPNANYYQREQHDERKHIYNHAALIGFLSIVLFEFSEAQ